jgi:lipoprotein NlpI
MDTIGRQELWSFVDGFAEGGRYHKGGHTQGRADEASGPMLLRIVLLSLGLIAFAAYAQQPADDPEAAFNKAVADFRSGRFAESAAGFDKVAKLVPDYAPQLWQRGIALYYAGRYQDCRAQFESHRTVNPADVENAAWHFLCVARAETPAKAKAALLPVGPDSRAPMRQIYQMFKGEIRPEQMLASAGPTPEAQFYAHLYAGLYFEATGNRERARAEITAAADHYTVGGYMHDVAVVHRDILLRSK